jgi:uncharacterized coiled-coil protein SlyX
MSKNKEELKPCPFCGFNKCELINPLNGTSPYVSCDKCHADFYAVSWNNAYCWKEIDSLKSQLAEKCNHKYIFSPIDTELHVRELENKLAESEKALAERDRLLLEKERLLQKVVEGLDTLSKPCGSFANVMEIAEKYLKEIRSSVGGSK